MKKKIDAGGVPVTPEEIREAREKLANTGGTAIKQVLAAIDNPLASCDYWGEINRALAADPTLVVPPKTKSGPAQHAKIVFDIVLARKEAEALGLPQDEIKEETAKIESPGKGPGHDLITGRRTAKKNYAENMAAEWGWTIPGVVDVEQVGDKVPQAGLRREGHPRGRHTDAHRGQGHRGHRAGNVAGAGPAPAGCEFTGRRSVQHGYSHAARHAVAGSG